jgi:hypothetical protein
MTEQQLTTVAEFSPPVDIHPAADLFPPMTGAAFDHLVEDIRREHAVRVPVVFWIDPETGSRWLLDGRNRLRAAELAIGQVGVLSKMGPLVAFPADGGEPIPVPSMTAEGDPFAIVASLNIERRHLSDREKRKLIADLLKARPELSDRETAKIARSTHKTVSTVRAATEANGEIPHKPAERLEASGRKARGRKPSRPISTQETVEPVVPQPAATREAGKSAPARQVVKPARSRVASVPVQQRRSQAVTEFCALLRTELAPTLEDLVRILKDERGRIADLPQGKRVALARGCLAALGVELDDLRPVE